VANEKVFVHFFQKVAGVGRAHELDLALKQKHAFCKRTICNRVTFAK
jgi:hypothetical protein